jgi:hypothetical protein
VSFTPSGTQQGAGLKTGILSTHMAGGGANENGEK